MKKLQTVKPQYISRSYGSILHIWEPVFQSNYYYIIAKDYQEYCAVIKHHFEIESKEERENEPLGHTTCYEGKKGTMVFIWTKERTPDVLAHECLHAVAHELNARGVVMTLSNDEIFAYFLQFLMREIIKFTEIKRKP